ncbi:hypothetical protein U0070_013596 [Myodes glareolus]|uniref:CD47-like transmembrane domain-containing protein n=1 Tax=Myodes glareolus TaxID=447135 RepID=A0AAW0JMH2_MYOGA
MASLVTELCNSLFFFQALKYKSTRTNKKIILLLVAGSVLTVIVIVGAILLIPGENPVKSASGLGLIVISIGILIPLQYNVFMTAFGMASFTIAILITQVLGYVLALVGLCLCIMVVAYFCKVTLGKETIDLGQAREICDDLGNALNFGHIELITISFSNIC